MQLHESLPSRGRSRKAVFPSGYKHLRLEDSSAIADANSIELNHAVSLARRRLIPFLLLMYIVSFLDRANIGFVKQTLQTSVGISTSAYALGAGLFFVSYALFEVPSNLILHRVGARLWLSRIMVSWGLVSMATIFVTGPRSFYLLRLLLGATEAGFFPGVIFYLIHWFPNRSRGQVFGMFYFGAPLAFIFGAPISGLLLQMRPWLSLHNWQWMFLAEGTMAVLVGIWAFRYLDDSPSNAAWLPVLEKHALVEELSQEESERRSRGPIAVLPMLLDLRVLYFVLIYFLLQMSVYGVIFYLPAQVAGILYRPTGVIVGLVTAVPWICALIVTFWLPRMADRWNKHRQFAALTMLISGCASLVFPTSGPMIGLLTLSIAASGLIAVQPLFWKFPTGYLAGSAAAGGIAFINALGNVGAFFAPNAKVWADVHFASTKAGLYLLAALTLVNAGLMAAMHSSDGPTVASHRSTT